MQKLNNDVKNLLNDEKIWIMSTMGDAPNAIPVLFKKVSDDDMLILFDVFMNKSIKNIQKNAKVSVTVYDLDTLTGYQLKGTAQYSASAAFIEEGNAITKNFNLETKGAVIVSIENIIVLSPGPDNGKIL
jgi:hypothetical protein